MKRTFRGEIFIYYIIIFIIFTVAVLTFQYKREKSFRTIQLENSLNYITETTHKFIEEFNLVKTSNLQRVTELSRLLPQDSARITIIGKNGKVWYDSFVTNYKSMENHANREEIIKASKDGSGSNIRASSTINETFYYYAKSYPNYYVRTALIYNIEVRDLLKASRTFIFFIVILFLVVGLILVFVSLKLSNTITQLKNFALKAGRNELIENESNFEANELGVISSQIVQIYNNLKRAKDELTTEKEKLLNHLNALDEAVAFFSPQKVKTLSNGRFIQIVNYISRKEVVSDKKMLNLPVFKKLNTFVDKQLLNHHKSNGKTRLPKLDYTISKSEKYFRIQAIFFADSSFEVIITNVTGLEKRRLMKQQLTSNIAHELKTPLSSIRGYLETILDNWPIADEKLKYFLEKAFFQSERLTNLINDVSLINNVTDAGELFELKTIDIKNITNDIYEYFASKLEDNNINFIDEVQKGTIINGNESLLFSVFQNLMENSINYGGKNILIHIKCYHEDDKYYYFSYFNSGTEIPKEHLPRIFERFYRVDKGRTRATGGTGLGLAIVKNAINLHNGRVSVKNRPQGGVEFLFSLSKK